MRGKHIWGGVFLVAVLTFAPTAGAGASENRPTERQLLRRGAKLWSYYCTRCHNARPGGEFNRLEWDTLTLHMRVRANLPARDAEALRVYLRSSH